MQEFSRIIQELAPGYLAARKQEIPEMMKLLAEGDFKRLSILSHSMRGSGASFGFPEITKFGAALENHARQSDLVSFGQELGRLKKYLDELELGKPVEGS